MNAGYQTFNSGRRFARQAMNRPEIKTDHAHRREGDEIACSCGARWSYGERHPTVTTTIVSGLPLDIGGLAAEIHAGNIAVGWWKTDPETGRTLHRNTGEMLALVHSEISEADEGFEGGLMDDKLPHRRMVEVELADVAIRVLDMLGFYQWKGWSDPDDEYRGGVLEVPGTDDWHAWCRAMHRQTTKALEGFRKGSNVIGVQSLTSLLALVDLSAGTFSFDLTGAIAEKRQFNATRADHRPEVRAAAGGKAF